MTLTISLPADVEAKVLERARARGQTPGDYVSGLVKQAVYGTELDDALAPFRRQVADSGMTDEQLDAFLEDLRDKTHASRRLGE